MHWVFVSLVLWGAWAFLPKIATKYLSSTRAFMTEVAGGLVVACVAISIGGFKFEMGGMGYAYLAGLCSYLGVLLYIWVLKGGSAVSLASAITGLYPAVTVLLGVSLLDENPSSQQWLGTVVAVVAMVFLNMPQQSTTLGTVDNESAFTTDISASGECGLSKPNG